MTGQLSQNAPADGTMPPNLSRRRLFQAAAAGAFLTACKPWRVEGPLGSHAPYLRPMLTSDWVKQGLSGRGVTVAVIDAGFGGADVRASTRSLRIVASHDAVEPGRPEFFADAARHGTDMLEAVGGRQGELVYGLAHGADYLLARGEDQFSEFLSDERNAIEAIRWSIANGAEVLSISLGYTVFEDGRPYGQKSLNGRTSSISRALAELLAENPELVAVVSAGNQGDKPWTYITFPGDVEEALTVGSVELDLKTPRASSGRGPDHLPWIKPDVVVPSGRGASSLATAAVAGLIACLKEKHPSASRRDILRAVRSTASRAEIRDRALGYGVPSADRTQQRLGGVKPLSRPPSTE